MSETKEMQQRIEEKIGLTPDDKSVVVLYDGERDKVCQIVFQSITNYTITISHLSFIWNL